MLPNNIYFTGVPGSKWSGIAQKLESLAGFNITDRNENRVYKHNSYGGHVGAYFGTGMEFPADTENSDQAYSDPSAGCKIIKSHEWAYQLNSINRNLGSNWIMLVYRPDTISNAWWHQAGGFNITYPNYDHYLNSVNMHSEIARQNQRLLEFGSEHECKWEYFTSKWIKEQLQINVKPFEIYNDILVTLVKK